MNSELPNISIINKNNGILTGESASALPIRILTSFSWVNFFIFGILAASLFLVIIFFLAKTQVQTVEIVGKSQDFQILELK